MIIRTISILCISFSLFCGEAEPETKLPAAVQSILNKAESAVQKNRIAYDNANEKAFSDTEKQLKGELDKLTKAGKLLEAVAVKKTLETFRVDIVAKIDENSKKKDNGDLLGEDMTSIRGMWKMSFASGATYTLNFMNENIVSNTNVSSISGTGKYSFDSKTKKVVITWASGQVDTLSYDKDSFVGTSSNGGQRVMLEKIKNPN
jgi:hypothetical protein